MRKNDFVLIAGIILFALLFAVIRGSFFYHKGNVLVITADGKEFGRYPLDEDRIIRIGDTNTCEIRDGRVSMTEADCPDKICVHSKPVSSAGEGIVCLPNKIILKIEGNKEEGPDTVAG